MANLTEYTLYTGGLKGTEAEFGRMAERWGMNEITFSFSGHVLEREKNLRVLTATELKQGHEVLMQIAPYMGQKIGRGYKIQSVIRSLYHLVLHSEQVFAIGWILDDKTVKGGTGWGVELAKVMERPLSVYHQGEDRWFTWQNNEWIPEIAIIRGKTFTGTGTRFLTANGKIAINTLFERSFGPAPA